MRSPMTSSMSYLWRVRSATCRQVSLPAPLQVALLERALFDLYHTAVPSVNERSIERPPPPLMLKDLLATDVITACLPLEGAAWLREMFSPRCLNLRNLVWHGFLAPAATPSERPHTPEGLGASGFLGFIDSDYDSTSAFQNSFNN
jgi:hypothetical protein